MIKLKVKCSHYETEIDFEVDRKIKDVSRRGIDMGDLTLQEKNDLYAKVRMELGQGWKPLWFDVVGEVNEEETMEN